MPGAQGVSISWVRCLGTNIDRGFSLCLQGCEGKGPLLLNSAIPEQNGQKI